MKNDPYHSWKAPCSFRVATGSPVLRPASSGCDTPGCTRCLHGRNTVPSRSDYGSFFIRVLRDRKLISPRICWCAKDHAGCLPGVYTVMPQTTRMIPERWAGMIRGAIRECVKAPLVTKSDRHNTKAFQMKILHSRVIFTCLEWSVI